MARVTQAQREAERFRAQAADLLRDPGWLDEEVQRWLRRELEQRPDYIYSEKEHAALRRITAASTLFESWGGYSVSELAVGASQYLADCSYEAEVFIKNLLANGTTKLRLMEMGWLVKLATRAGIPLPPFDPEVESYDEAA
jgi:hypothetical protein